MPSVADILNALDRIAPERFAFSFDKVGLQIGNPSAHVQSVMVSLDASLTAIIEAGRSGSGMLIAHHPIIWDPIKQVRFDDYVGRRIIELVDAKIALVAAHTNWDCAKGGINDSLAEQLELTDIQPFGEAGSYDQFLLTTYVPRKQTNAILDALSEAGAGVIGLYERCAFLHEGKGTFRPLPGSDPAVGSIGKTEEIDEVRVEMLVPGPRKQEVGNALLAVHEYEVPAIHWSVLERGTGVPIGRIGMLSSASTLAAFAASVERKLSTKCLFWGEPLKTVRSVAVCGGSADETWKEAAKEGVDVLVTGEVRHHVAVEAADSGFALIAAGHYATEQPGAVRLGEHLKKVFPSLEIHRFEPAAGHAGRPAFLE